MMKKAVCYAAHIPLNLFIGNNIILICDPVQALIFATKSSDQKTSEA